ncbi:MAG: hypothetical protein ACQERN_09745 [Thermodesulfobacteriota bacterium]
MSIVFTKPLIVSRETIPILFHCQAETLFRDTDQPANRLKEGMERKSGFLKRRWRQIMAAPFGGSK